MSHTTIAATFNGTLLMTWPKMIEVVEYLRGDVAYFQPLYLACAKPRKPPKPRLPRAPVTCPGCGVEWELRIAGVRAVPPAE